MTAYYDDVRGVGCSRVLAILDEIFRTGMPKLYDYATTVCGRNISLLVNAQSESQLEVISINLQVPIKASESSIMVKAP
jgi:hypothetical protein